MNVEVVEFFPLTIDEAKGMLTGTMKVRLPEIGLHILGIYVTKKKDFYYFTLPGKKAIHAETGDPVRYPFVVFEDREKQRLLMDAIREQGRTYIEKRLGDKANPIVIPEMQSPFSESQKIFAQPQPRIDEHKRDGEQLIQKKAATSSKMSTTGWMDPPKREKPFRRGYKNDR